MDINALTPEELRDLAAKKEAAELHRSHIPECDRIEHQSLSALKPWERAVEVDDTTYIVDMRRLKDTKCLRLILNAKEHESEKAFIDAFDYIFASIDDQITAVVTDEMGYDDAERHYEIERKLFEAIQAKN